MDRPDELTCHRCHKGIGYLANDIYTMRCSKCGVYSQPGKGDRGVPATAKVMELQRRLEELDRDFEEGKRPFLVRYGRSRYNPGTEVPPDQQSVGLGVYLAAIFGMLAFVLGLSGFFLLSLALLSAAVLAYWIGDPALEAKREGYARLKSNWESEKLRTLKELLDQIR